MEEKREKGFATWADEFKGVKGELALRIAYSKAEDFRGLIYNLSGRLPFMLDRDVAAIYGIETRRLMEQVRRNIDRFSEEMIFQLTDEECELLVSQNAIPSKSYFGGHLPYGFTQLGANKVAFYLKSEIADIRATQILKAFLHFENLHRKRELGKVDPLLIEQTASEAKSQGVQIGFTISRVAAKHDVPVEIIFMILKFRKNGLTQQQAAYAFGLKYWHIQDIEKSLRKVGIEIPPIRKNKVDKDIMDDMDAILFGSNMTTPEKGGIRYE